jgi:hypothetical protein
VGEEDNERLPPESDNCSGFFDVDDPVDNTEALPSISSTPSSMSKAAKGYTFHV